MDFLLDIIKIDNKEITFDFKKKQKFIELKEEPLSKEALMS